MTNIPSDGDQAPDFTLPTDTFEDFKLSSQRGKTVVLYFYPRDHTPGCTQQAVEFTEVISEFTASGAIVVGISADDPECHSRFKENNSIGFTLVSDMDSVIINEYGVWVEKNMYGKKYMGIERTTFLINKDGKIQKVWRKVKLKGHVAEVLAEVKKMN